MGFRELNQGLESQTRCGLILVAMNVTDEGWRSAPRAEIGGLIVA